MRPEADGPHGLQDHARAVTPLRRCGAAPGRTLGGGTGPPLDHAAEANPHHDHLVLTANGIAWAPAAPPHAHGAAATHAHAPAGVPPRAGGVAVIARTPSAAATVLGLTATTAVGAAPATPVWSMPPGASVDPPAPPSIHSLAWDPGDPPPRPL